VAVGLEPGLSTECKDGLKLIDSGEGYFSEVEVGEVT